jgi:hypothetical protein
MGRGHFLFTLLTLASRGRVGRVEVDLSMVLCQ